MTQMPNSYRHCAEFLAALGQEVQNLKDEIGVSNEDARGVGLSNIKVALIKSGLILNILCTGEENRMSAVDFLNLTGFTGGSAQDAADIIEKYERHAVLTEFQFQVENMLRRIRTELNLDEVRGFWNTTKTLIEHLDLENPADCQSLIYLPAILRNSRHANGIHHGTSSTITVNDVEFEFVDGEAVHCAGWGHVAISIQASISIVRQILTHETVLAIPDPVFEQYAWDIATQPET
ncbi:MAG: hypothetical protein ABJ363_16065 [Alphaproteobacteria bacterium]